MKHWAGGVVRAGRGGREVGRGRGWGGEGGGGTRRGEMKEDRGGEGRETVGGCGVAGTESRGREGVGGGGGVGGRSNARDGPIIFDKTPKKRNSQPKREEKRKRDAGDKCSNFHRRRKGSRESTLGDSAEQHQVRKRLAGGTRCGKTRPETRRYGPREMFVQRG